jgi:hypothetical protein
MIDFNFVENIPEKLENNKIYVSKKYEVAIHLCPCCNQESVTPLGENGWKLNEKSLTPSILNPCGKHYFIKNFEFVFLN